MRNYYLNLSIVALLMISYTALAQDNLFISEIADPMDEYSGRFVEIYNPGTEAVDFSTYTFYLSRQSNGGSGWGDLQLEGIILPGKTFVIGGTEFEILFGFAPDQESGILIGNGDDAYILFKEGDHNSGILQDIYGVRDTDGSGEAWEYENSRALRAGGIYSPNPNWIETEWEINLANYRDFNPGSHDPSINGNNNPLPIPKILSLTTDTVVFGQEILLRIEVNHLTQEDNIISYQFCLDYDSTLLDYSEAIIDGTIAEGGSIAVNEINEGRIGISYMYSEAILNSGPIIELHFNSSNIGMSELILSEAWLNSAMVDSIIQGSVLINPATPPSAQITYDDSTNRYQDTLQIIAHFNEEMDAAMDVHINLKGVVILEDAVMQRQSPTTYSYLYPIPKAYGDVFIRLSNGTNLWGIETDSIPLSGETFTILKFMPGDVDDDGFILAYDAALTLQHSVGLDPLPAEDPLPWEAWRDSTANVDGVGAISANDAGLILQYSAGIISSFPGVMKKSVSEVIIEAQVEGNDIVFYSWGELNGLNLTAEDHRGLLGVPVTLAGDCLWAFNRTGFEYNFGLCTSKAAFAGDPLFKIPYQSGGTVTFGLLVNTEESFLTVNLPTSHKEYRNDDVLIYPIPAKEQIFIKLAHHSSNEGLKIRILDQKGRIIHEEKIVDKITILESSQWKGEFFYIQMIDRAGKGLLSKKIILQ